MSKPQSSTATLRGDRFLSQAKGYLSQTLTKPTASLVYVSLQAHCLAVVAASDGENDVGNWKIPPPPQPPTSAALGLLDHLTRADPCHRRSGQSHPFSEQRLFVSA